MAKKAKKIETKAKKKKWCVLLAPKIFVEQEIGETLYDLPSDIIGKRVSANLMNLTGDPKRQSFNVAFEIVDVKEGKATTECVGFVMTAAGVKRLVRRNRERIDESFVAMTSDGKMVRVKPFVLTRFNTSQSVKRSLRKALLVTLEKILSSTPFDSLLRELIAGKVQQKLKETLKKVYPVNIIEIREIRLLSKSEQAKVKKPLLKIETEQSAAPEQPAVDEEKDQEIPESEAEEIKGEEAERKPAKKPGKPNKTSPDLEETGEQDAEAKD